MRLYLLTLICIILSSSISAQEVSSDKDENEKIVVVTRTDGQEYVGVIISDDGREVLIDSKSIGKIYIAKSDIKSIVKLDDTKSVINGEFQPTGPFTTRFAFTNNAFPIEKGENYAIVNIHGPEAHFAVSNKFNVGIISTWIASPMVLAMKYSFSDNDSSNVHYSFGTLLGTTGYLNSFKGYGGLHWLSMTMGNRKNNVTFSSGYVYLQSGVSVANVGVFEGVEPTTSLRPMTHGGIVSIAGIYKVGAKASIIFDSMIGLLQSQKTTETRNYPTYEEGGDYKVNVTVTKKYLHNLALFIMPGMRFQSSNNSAYQIALAGVSVINSEGSFSMPIPMLTYFYKF